MKLWVRSSSLPTAYVHRLIDHSWLDLSTLNVKSSCFASSSHSWFSQFACLSLPVLACWQLGRNQITKCLLSVNLFSWVETLFFLEAWSMSWVVMRYGFMQFLFRADCIYEALLLCYITHSLGNITSMKSDIGQYRTDYPFCAKWNWFLSVFFCTELMHSSG